MNWLSELYANQPFWIWVGVGGLILTAELATGSGWLLWPWNTMSQMKAESGALL